MTSYRHIAVFQPGRAGDFVLTTPLCDAIKAFAPDSRLTLIVGPRAAEMARAHPSIDRVWVFDRAPHRLAGLAARLLTHRFDLWLDPKIHPSRNGAMAATLARARVKVGYNGPKLRPFTHDLAEFPDPGGHYIEQVLGCLGPPGIPAPEDPRPTVGLTPEAEAWAQDQLPADHAPVVVVNISAGHPTRYWTGERWIELLRSASAFGESDLLLSAAPEDAAVAARIVREVAASGIRIRQLPRSGLVELAALVRRADLVLTVDTSFVHLAAAFDRPIVALYKHAYPEVSLFAPRSTVQEMVISEPGTTVASIPVDAVARAVERIREGERGKGNREGVGPPPSRHR